MVLKLLNSASAAAVWQAVKIPSLIVWSFGSAPLRQETVGAIGSDCQDSEIMVSIYLS